MMKLIIPLSLLILFFCGLFFRIYRLDAIPAGFNQDEAVVGYDVYSLSSSGHDHHGAYFPVLFQNFNDWAFGLLHYVLVPFISVMGLSIFSTRLPLALMSSVSILLIYYIASRLFKQRGIGLIASFLFTFSSFAIAGSRWSVMFFPAFPMLISLYLLVKSLSSRFRNLFRLAMIVSLAIATYSYFTMIVFIPFVFPLFLWYSYSGEKIRIRNIIQMLTMFMVLVLPLYFTELRSFSHTGNRFQMISLFSQPGLWPVNYALNYLSYFLPTPLFLPGEANPVRAIPGFGYELAVYGVFFYTGVINLILQLVRKTPFRKQSIILLYPLSIAPVLAAFTIPGGVFARTVYIQPIITIITAYGFWKLLNLSGHYISVYFAFPYKNAILLSGGFFVSAVLINFTFFLSVYYGKNYQTICQWYFQNGMDKVIAYTSENGNHYKQIIMDTTINMPYIYVLFFTKADPSSLPTSDFATIDPLSGWLSVKRYKNYDFRKVTESEVSGARLVYSIYNSPYSQYAFYEKNHDLLVHFETKRM